MRHTACFCVAVVLALFFWGPVPARSEPAFTFPEDGGTPYVTLENGTKVYGIPESGGYRFPVSETETMYVRVEVGGEMPVVEDVPPSDPPMPDAINSVMLEEILLAESRGKVVFARLLGANGLDEADYMQLTGITEEQKAIVEAKSDSFEEPLTSRFNELGKDFDEKTPEEQAAIEEECRSLFREAVDTMHATFCETLTPEQLQRVRELELVLPSVIFGGGDMELDSMNSDAYEALGLSDEQRKELDAILEEMNREQKELMKEFVAFVTNPEPEQGAAYLEKWKALRTRFKARALALLTAEQQAKLEILHGDWAKKIASIQAAEEGNDMPEDDSWKKSWKPGDPIPEGALPPRKKSAFPFGD